MDTTRRGTLQDMELTAIQAAYLANVNERTIRRALASGKIVATKQHGEWQIALSELRRHYTLRASRVEELEARDPETLAARITELERALIGNAQQSRPILVQHPVQQVRPVTQDEFANRSQAARWLARHGVNPLNPSNWAGWREVELTPRAVLALAMRIRERAKWRIPWRLVRCADASCVCQVMLEGER